MTNENRQPADPDDIEREEERLDEQVEESFPASDPPSTSVPIESVGSPEPRESEEGA